jgi:hypothetical protein
VDEQWMNKTSLSTRQLIHRLHRLSLGEDYVSSLDEDYLPMPDVGVAVPIPTNPVLLSKMIESPMKELLLVNIHRFPLPGLTI